MSVRMADENRKIHRDWKADMECNVAVEVVRETKVCTEGDVSLLPTQRSLAHEEVLVSPFISRRRNFHAGLSFCWKKGKVP